MNDAEPTQSDSAGAHAPRRRRRLLVGPMAAVFASGVVFATLVLTGATAHGAVSDVSTAPQDIQNGEQLFDAHCSSCHGANGVGSVRGPALVSVGAAAADFYLTTGRMPLNDPHDQPIRHHPLFNSQQVRDIVAYVNDLPTINGVPGKAGPTIPTVAPLCINGESPTTGCVTLADGQQGYALNCAACHQGAGAGGTLSKGDIIPGLSGATAIQVAEAVRTGPKPMPIFGPNELSNSQVSAIARYVEYLHHPDDAGGLSLGHFGPVGEGLIGIVIGLGLLLLVSRIMGTRE